MIQPAFEQIKIHVCNVAKSRKYLNSQWTLSGSLSKDYFELCFMYFFLFLNILFTEQWKPFFIRYQGFQMVHALGGGTGSGMGSLLINKIRNNQRLAKRTRTKRVSCTLYSASTFFYCELLYINKRQDFLDL